MSDPLPIPDELWSTVPPEAQAAIAAVFLAMQQRITELENQLRDLQARLGLNSTNSSKPPSSDPIGLKRKPPALPSGRSPVARRAPTARSWALTQTRSENSGAKAARMATLSGGRSKGVGLRERWLVCHHRSWPTTPWICQPTWPKSSVKSRLAFRSGPKFDCGISDDLLW
jgi:hypothetical protein